MLYHQRRKGAHGKPKTDVPGTRTQTQPVTAAPVFWGAPPLGGLGPAVQCELTQQQKVTLEPAMEQAIAAYKHKSNNGAKAVGDAEMAQIEGPLIEALAAYGISQTDVVKNSSEKLRTSLRLVIVDGSDVIKKDLTSQHEVDAMLPPGAGELANHIRLWSIKRNARQARLSVDIDHVEAIRQVARLDKPKRREWLGQQVKDPGEDWDVKLAYEEDGELKLQNLWTELWLTSPSVTYETGKSAPASTFKNAPGARDVPINVSLEDLRQYLITEADRR